MSPNDRLARGDEGFTLVETVMATAIAALLLGTLGTAIFQFSTIMRLHSASLTVNQQVQSAAAMLNRDVVGAADGVVGADGALTLYVPAYSFGEQSAPITHTVSYIVDGQNLVRSDDAGSMVVARHVTAIDFGDPGPVGPTVEVTVAVTSGGREHSTTLQFHRRPG